MHRISKNMAEIVEQQGEALKQIDTTNKKALFNTE